MMEDSVIEGMIPPMVDRSNSLRTLAQQIAQEELPIDRSTAQLVDALTFRTAQVHRLMKIIEEMASVGAASSQESERVATLERKLAEADARIEALTKQGE